MKKVLLSFIFVIFVFKVTYCQSVQKLNKTGSTEILLDKKVDTFVGPHGNITQVFASNDMLDSITLSGYPTLKNLPDTLTGVRVYTIIFDPEQFYYQNYRNGIYTKKFFEGYFKKQNKVLSDTTMLTQKMVKCYFSYAIGNDCNKIPKFVMDTNGNNDFADESLFTLINKKSSNNLADNNPINVAIEYFDGKNVSSENILCLLSLNRSSIPDKIEAGVSFPQFRYAKISFEGKNFYVCSNLNPIEKSIYLFDARPNFKPLYDLVIKSHQIATFGNAYFRYEPISQNLDRIKFISGYNNSDKKVLNANPIVKETPHPLVSEQVKMLAPEIKGVNVNDGTILSLNALRGKYVFLDFWATWCGPCILEFPYIRKVYDTFSNDQLVIMGLTEDDNNGKIKTFLIDKKVTWPTIVKSSSTTKTKGYNIARWPTSFLIGPDGIIIATNLRGDDLFMCLENLKIKKK